MYVPTLYCTGKTFSNTVSVWYDMYIVHCTVCCTDALSMSRVTCEVWQLQIPYPEYTARYDLYRHLVQTILSVVTFTDTLFRVYDIYCALSVQTPCRVYFLGCMTFSDTNIPCTYTIHSHIALLYSLHLIPTATGLKVFHCSSNFYSYNGNCNAISSLLPWQWKYSNSHFLLYTQQRA